MCVRVRVRVHVRVRVCVHVRVRVCVCVCVCVCVWLEHSAWIRKLGFESPSGRDIFCLKNFDTFTRTPVSVLKMNVVAPAQLTFQIQLYFKISIPPEPVLKNMVQQTSGPDSSNGKSIWHESESWGSTSPQVDTFLSQKLWHFHKNTRSYVENECCCPRTVYTSNITFT